MRVLVLSTDAYGGHGGIALYTRDLVEAIAMHPQCEEIVVLPRVIRNVVEGVPANVRFVAESAGGSASYVRTLSRITRAERFDLVVCGHINLLPLTRFGARNPLLFVYGFEAWRPPKRRHITSFANVRGVVSISQVTLERFLDWSHMQARCFILPNAIRAQQYGIRPRPQALAERLGIGNRRVLLGVGRLATGERYKGFEEVMEVLPAIDDAVFVIAGDGDDRPRLEQRARSLGVADRVLFTGLFPEEEKNDLYALADTFVMPSRGEGFGFVFLEALASGLPVIAGKHDGGREALRNGMLGIVVDETNPAEIAAAIRESLARSKGIPEGLSYFAFGEFAARVHAIINALR
jgi:phosphatidylinositol alpha-1,6-mannosyltransferase